MVELAGLNGWIGAEGIALTIEWVELVSGLIEMIGDSTIAFEWSEFKDECG